MKLLSFFGELFAFCDKSNWFSMSLGASTSLRWDTTVPFLGLFAECHQQVLILNVLWWTVKWEECVKAFSALLRYCSVEGALYTGRPVWPTDRLLDFSEPQFIIFKMVMM